jgi:large subunit ribosomal protein L9
MMKVLFVQNMPGTAARGEMKDVKDGYARNFLIPSRIAVEANAASLKQFEEEKKRGELKKQKKVALAEDVRKKMAKVSLTITTKAGPDDKLFGAVTTEDIARTLQEQASIEIDRHQILLDQPLKKLGIYKIAVRLSEEVEGEVKVWVVREKENA